MDNRSMQPDLIIVVFIVVILTQSINQFSVNAVSSVAMPTADVTSDENRKTARKKRESETGEEMESLAEVIRRKRKLFSNKKQVFSDGENNNHNNNDDDDDDDEAKPMFLTANQNVSVSSGERAILVCRVKHLGRKTVTWRRRGDLHPMTIGRFIFVSDVRLKVEHNELTSIDWTLIINDVKTSDEGTYQCQINTKDDQYNHFDVHLQVRTMEVHGTQMVERGAPIELWCNVSGRPDPPHNIEWFKDGHMVESNSAAGITIKKKISTHLLVSTLVIRRSKMADAGVYHCRTTTSSTTSSTAIESSFQSQEGGAIAVRILSAPVEKRANKVYEMKQSEVRLASSWINVVVCAYIGWKERHL